MSTTEDYKKYIYALGIHRVRRLYDSVGGSIWTSTPAPRLRARWVSSKCGYTLLRSSTTMPVTIWAGTCGISWEGMLSTLTPIAARSRRRSGGTAAGSHTYGIPTRYIPRTAQAKSLIWKKNRGAGEG
jgi:hypothetical protein